MVWRARGRTTRASISLRGLAPRATAGPCRERERGAADAWRETYPARSGPNPTRLPHQLMGTRSPMAQVASKTIIRNKKSPARERVLSPFPSPPPRPHTTSSASRPSPVTQKRTASPSSHGRQAGRPEKEARGECEGWPAPLQQNGWASDGPPPSPRHAIYIFAHPLIRHTKRASG